MSYERDAVDKLHVEFGLNNGEPEPIGLGRSDGSVVTVDELAELGLGLKVYRDRKWRYVALIDAETGQRLSSLARVR